jgi:hypothetical protein
LSVSNAGEPGELAHLVQSGAQACRMRATPDVHEVKEAVDLEDLAAISDFLAATALNARSTNTVPCNTAQAILILIACYLRMPEHGVSCRRKTSARSTRH